MAWDKAMACAGPPDTTLFIVYHYLIGHGAEG